MPHVHTHTTQYQPTAASMGTDGYSYVSAALYPLQYLVDQLALRSSATQSASLQALKFFYEFWHQKYGMTFCFSFYSSNHNPLIAIEELTAIFSLSGKWVFMCTSVNHRVYTDHASTSYKHPACACGYSIYQISD